MSLVRLKLGLCGFKAYPFLIYSLSLSFYPKNIPTNSSSFSFSLFAIYCPLSSSLFLPLSLYNTISLSPSLFLGWFGVSLAMYAFTLALAFVFVVILIEWLSNEMLIEKTHKICMWFGVLAQIEQRCRKPPKKKKKTMCKRAIWPQNINGAHM